MAKPTLGNHPEEMTVLDKIQDYLKRHWRRLAIWFFLIIPIASFFLVSICIQIFAFWPNNFNGIDFALFESKTSHQLVMAHGMKDGTNTWINELNSIYEKNSYDGIVSSVDWSAYSLNTFRCAPYGKRIGQRVGESIAKNTELKSLHLISHSCGGFVIYGICEAIRKIRPEISVQTTYLDPVSIYGISRNYGLKHFGSCADYSEAYIDTGDHIPGSNQLLPLTHTYDVSKVRMRIAPEYPPHNWPTEYYRQLVRENIAPDLRFNPTLKEKKPAGILEIVD
ncbi:hypothetical protein [Aurantivibrio infirmus]